MAKDLARLLLLMAALTVVLGCRNEPPSIPVRPIGPASFPPGDTVEFLSVAFDPEDKSVALRFSWGLGDTSDWTDWARSGETAGLRHSWPMPGCYEIRARARDMREAVSDWSEALAVVVGRSPRTPSLRGGARDGWIDSTYVWEVVSTDLDGNPVSYVIDWGDGTLDTTTQYPSGSWVPVEHAWAEPDSHYLRARSIDVTGLESDWSEAIGVRIRDPLGPGILLWRYATRGPVFACPAIGTDGTLYFGSEDSGLYALNPDGSLEWRYQAEDWIGGSAAVGPDGAVLFGCYDGRVYCLNPDGTLRWRFETGGEISSSPAVDPDGNCYIGSGDRKLYCLGPDGIRRWEFETGDWVVSSPALAADGTVYFGGQDSWVYALKADGNLRWRYGTGGWIQGSAGLGPDGSLYIASFDGNLYALSPEGERRWQVAVGEWVLSSPAVDENGMVFIGSDQRALIALLPDGSEAWRIELPGPAVTGPALTDDGIVYAAAGRRLCAIDSYGVGSVEWVVDVGGEIQGSPAIGPDGTVYFGSSDGYLNAVRGSGGLGTSSWPKFRRDARNTGQAGPGW